MPPIILFRISYEEYYSRYRSAKEQKQKDALAESEKRISTGMDGTLPKGGAALWTEWK